MKLALKIAIAAVLGVSPFVMGQAAQPASAEAWQQLVQYDFGEDRTNLTSIETEIRNAMPAQYPAIEAKLLPSLNNPATTVDSKRFICRMLGIVGSPQSVPAIAPLLADEKLNHPARIALETLPNPQAGAALRDAAGKVKGKLLVGVISSIGVRRDAQAVAILAPLTSSEDAKIANGAICALGEIGTPEAVAALKGVKAPESLQRQLVRAQLTAALRLTQAGKATEAAALYQSMLDNRDAPNFRVAALRGLISTGTGDAVKLASAALQGNDVALRDAAAAAVLASTDKGFRNAMAGQIPTLRPQAQVVLLTVLADQTDVALRPVALKLIGSAEADVKAAAFDALIHHGTAADLPMLVQLAATDKPDSPARRVLNQMRAADINDALAKLLDAPDVKTLPTVLAVIGSRRVEAALPRLVGMSRSADAAVAIEAVKGLGVIGTPAQIAPLGALIGQTTDVALRDAAVKSARDISLRAEDKAAASKALVAAIDSARGPAARIALLKTLSAPADAAALHAVVMATTDTNAEIAEAAVRELVAWPAFDAGKPMIAIARSTTNTTHAVLALRGALRLVSSSADAPVPQRVALVKDVLESAKRPDEKKQAIAALGGLRSAEALELLRMSVKEPAIAEDAVRAMVRLTGDIGGVYQKQSMTALEEARAATTNDGLRQQIDGATARLKDTGQSDGFIIAWLMAGPFTQAEKDAGALFGIAFPPEKNTTSVNWQPVAATRDSKKVELDKALGGGQDRVAYMKTELVSDKVQDALLEMGSDDGIKVWLNGQEVHANSVTRPAVAGQDKAKIKLKQGTNALLVKVTQGGGEWQAIVRVRAADGGPLTGVTISAPEK